MSILRRLRRATAHTPFHVHSWKNFPHDYWSDYYGISDGTHQFCEFCDMDRHLGYDMNTLWWHNYEQSSKAFDARVAYPPYLVWTEYRAGYWTFENSKKKWVSLAVWLK